MILNILKMNNGDVEQTIQMLLEVVAGQENSDEEGTFIMVELLILLILRRRTTN